MGVLATDVQYFLANPMGVTGYSGTGTPGNSLGNYMSTTQVSATPMDDLFLDLTGSQNAAEQTDYQCVFVMNNTASGDKLRYPWFWLPNALYTDGGASMAIAPDPIGVVPYDSGSQQAQLISQSTSAPSGISTWYQPSNSFNPGGFVTADIPPQYCVAIWVQRTATACNSITQSFSLTCTFVTNA